MKDAHVTTDFLVTYTGNLVEVWVDWIPAIDGHPEEPVQARLDGEVLVFEPVGETASERSPRRIEGLEAKIVADIAKHKNVALFISGPSGVIGEHTVTI